MPTALPTDDEVVAILAAYNALWPRPKVDAEPDPGVPAWRFSGRWWHDGGRGHGRGFSGR